MCTGAGVACGKAPVPDTLASNKWKGLKLQSFPPSASLSRMHQTSLITELCLKKVLILEAPAVKLELFILSNVINRV